MELDVNTLQDFISKLPDPMKFKGDGYLMPLMNQDVMIKFEKRNFTDGSIRWILHLK